MAKAITTPLTDVEEIRAEIQHRLRPEARKSILPGMSDYLKCIRPVECADGLTMSVQAGFSHYCGPRDDAGPWRSVEVGFPSRRIEALMPYIDGGKTTDPTDTVYGYVPLSIVAQAIADAGGLLPEVEAAR